MTRIALGIEYDGAQHYGWQRQREVPSVQEHLEKALSTVANTPIEVQCAGRTDAGVHATGQVVHFDCDAVRPLKAWTMGVNANLPSSVAVKWCVHVSDDFNARFSATGRRYRYVIYNHKMRPAILEQGITHIHRPLNEQLMHEAAQALLGEQDFSAFRAALCQSKTPFRNVTNVTVSRHGAFVVVDISANAFLHHMVRNIVGSLVEIGSGHQPVDWIATLLAGRDRTLSAATAKPNGLYLVKVDYPDEFGLPEQPLGPLFLPD
ncbi:MAG: tRNA pseudouridine(38-40) synthase TruA [Aestuariibacter sp.]|jgi:tRNA pseudouridine38-40 synthase|uniref:tRNA pseudouridine(38-40) synthase TruA n=1 Tax=Marisediminitalea aggregata TaxID=634436 RepID=UPI0020CBA4A6|nr:tRNA pseudouridine(38-40) synthase TruA [Marisediminitalea aggregata]MCP3865597.1 tRNA pseudouridine(38-40) synthase TruA [Aestuariibacter sp.]MCP4234222.1 tRNA pseudouridine(38-40) synthase TruA [Aestuariibacter sp.]MCP4525254.1 tRNA pseudouridine(38-40) synthase TruA [Aestuariibacter sp.]MCP4947271.1 tRNA pseudouridine(38-40) synthase TruA [Aestuariibacter sp.]MCP5011006.1 tRNA pseudouridine(38-40) synthase TruA [Aestuariibacter sp.]|tara:strand:- start:5230 stop:6018 length:789 start_codon:yes stop_codon:yes gene_type:complete